MKAVFAFCLICVLFLSGCARRGGESVSPESTVTASSVIGIGITSAAELAAFLQEGGKSAQLAADIDMGDTMLTLAAERGGVELIGGGHVIRGNAPCVIRLEDGCSLTLSDVAVEAGQTGLGLLGGGSLGGEFSVTAGMNAIQAAGAVTVATGSSLTLRAEAGSGIACAGLTLEEKAKLGVSASAFALSTGRGDFTLRQGARAVCEASGDSAVKTDGTLILERDAYLEAVNTGEHNGAEVGSLIAVSDATLKAKGGQNGVGLFVVELRADVALKGSSKPELRVEAGRGTVSFLS